MKKSQNSDSIYFPKKSKENTKLFYKFSISITNFNKVIKLF